MLREPDPSAERVKQEIDINKENLKFLNSFYIPLLSAAFAASISNNTMMSSFLMWIWGIWAFIFLIVITLIKQRVLAIINKLIQKL